MLTTDPAPKPHTAKRSSIPSKPTVDELAIELAKKHVSLHVQQTKSIAAIFIHHSIKKTIFVTNSRGAVSYYRDFNPLNHLHPAYISAIP